MTASELPFPTLTGVGAARLLERPWRIAVVGAGGWMGLASIEQLHSLLGNAFHERVICFGSRARTLPLRGGLRVPQRPLADLTNLAPAPTLVLHLAFLTQEKAGEMPREAYVSTNQAISNQVYDALEPIGAEGVFVASSGAVEMVGVAGANPNKALYGELKLRDEERFSRWAEERGRRTVVARIFGLSGPYINKLDSYALACFITDVLANRPIEIKSAWPVFRSYVAVDELMSVVFALLTDGEQGAITFDTGAHRGFEMDEIALGVARALDHHMGIARPAVEHLKADSYVGDGAIYRALREANRVTQIDFSTQVRETARYMAEFAGATFPRN
jgi:UDP-glucuronate decarboxylase